MSTIWKQPCPTTEPNGASDMSNQEISDKGKKNLDLFKDVTYGKSVDDIHEDKSKPKKSLSSEFVTLGGIPGHHLDSGSVLAPRASISPSIKSEVKEPSLDLPQYDDYEQVILDGQANDTVSALKKQKEEEAINLEAWWVSSPTWRRTVVFMCITLFLMTLLNVAVAIYFFTAKAPLVKDPYICSTANCVEVSDWVADSMDLNVNPCDNFYNFVCGNYRSDSEIARSIPPDSEVTFAKASVEFSGAALTASVLKPTPKNLEKVIPFYKACLDTRRRNAKGFDTLISILNETLGEFFDNITGFDTARGAVKVIDVTRRHGPFGFQLLHYPNIALLPPAPWITSLRKRLENDTQFAKRTRDSTLPKFYKKLWEKFNFTKEPMPYDEAARVLLLYFDLISREGVHNETKENVSEIVTKRIERILFNALRANFTIIDFLEVSSRSFTLVDLNRSPEKLNLMYNRTTVRRMVVSFYIFNIIHFFARDLDKVTFEGLALDSIFSEINDDRLILSNTASCLESSIRYLNQYAILRLIEAFGFRDGNELSQIAEEIVRRVQRAFRKLFITQIKSQLKPHHAYATEFFASHENFIDINFPFKTDENTRISDVAQYFERFKPGPDHLRNIYIASKIYQRESIAAWRRGRSERFTRQNLNLDAVRQFPDNLVKYENNLYPPIALFDKPFYLSPFSDLRAFGVAGANMFLAKSFVSLWKQNIVLLENERDGPLVRQQRMFFLNKWDELKNQSKMESKSVLNCTENADSSFDFLSNKALLNTLAFKIGLELLENGSMYYTPRDKLTRVLKLNIEPVFGPDGSVHHYEDVDKTPKNSAAKPQFIDRNKFDKFRSKSLRLIYTRAPGRLVNFTQEQVFFITAVRHHCFTNDRTNPNRLRRFGANMNQVLGQLVKFSETWNCPANSNMNPSKKCL